MKKAIKELKQEKNYLQTPLQYTKMKNLISEQKIVLFFNDSFFRSS